MVLRGNNIIMAFNFTKFNANIDLRAELHNLLYGNSTVVPIGQWIILRSYDLTQFSEFYNEITKEGVGGPKYKYTDYLYLTYKWNNLVRNPFTEQETQVGQMETPAVTFFFEHNVIIKESDEIYEFDWNNNMIRPVLSEIKKPYSTRYNIKSIQTYRLDYGRIEYITARTIKDIIKI